MDAYKLVKRRKNGTLGPLFINSRMVLPVGEWLEAEDHPTKGFAHRPGWHCCGTPHAPHLSKKGRVWCRVQIDGVKPFDRPESQGGRWYLAEWMRIIEVMDGQGQEEAADQ